MLGVSIALELFSLNAALTEFRHIKAGRSLKQTIDEAKLVSWTRGYFDEVNVMRTPYARLKDATHLIVQCKKAEVVEESLTSSAA